MPVRTMGYEYSGSPPVVSSAQAVPAPAAGHTPPPALAQPRPPRTGGGSSDPRGAPSAAPPWAASSHRGGRVSRELPRCLTPSVSTATVGQVQRFVDGLDAETALAWAHEIAPDDVPTFE